MIERPLTHHLEILRRVLRRRLGVFRVKGIGETGAFDRRLLDAVHRGGCRDASDLEDSRHHINDVHELLAQGARILDVAGPGDGHVLAGAAELRGVLLEPAKWRIKCPRPARRHVIVGLLGAPDVIPFQLRRGWHIAHAVKPRDFIGRAHRTALSARAVVAVDVDDECVVELAHVLDGLNDAPDLVVTIRLVGGEDFDLLDEELLLISAELIPWLKVFYRPRLHLRVRWDDAKLLLIREDAVAQLLVAVVEEVHVVDLVHPFLGRVMRRMRGTRCVFHEKWLARHRLVHAIEVINRVVRHGGDEIPSSRRLALEGINLRGVAEEVRLPLVGIAADEAVEILEAHASGPVIERPSLARLIGRRVVILTEPRCGITVVLEYAPDSGLVLWDDAVITGETGGLLGDHAEAHRVMVSPGDERGPRRRAKRGGVDVVIAQTALREAIHRRRRDDTAEGARHAKPGVIRDDEQDIGRTLRRHDARCPPRLGLQSVVFDHAAEFRIGRGQFFAVNGSGGAGRTRRAGGLNLCSGGRCECHQGNREHPTQDDVSVNQPYADTCFFDYIISD